MDEFYEWVAYHYPEENSQNTLESIPYPGGKSQDIEWGLR